MANPAVVLSHLQQEPRVEVEKRAAHHGRAGVWTVGPSARAVHVLALPALLPQFDRLVVLGIDDAPTDVDVARLARVDLRGNPAGARLSSEAAAWVWRRAANRLPPEPAAELRRLMSARHPFATRAIDPGPLILDLAWMRADPDLSGCLAMAAHFGLGPFDALLAYAGPRVTALNSTSDGPRS